MQPSENKEIPQFLILTFLTTPMWLATTAYNTFVVEPLRTLYLNGPQMFGFWNGRTMLQICAELTNQPELFWQSHESECASIVGKKFQTTLVTTQVLVYFAILWCGAHILHAHITSRIKQPTLVLIRPDQLRSLL